MYNDKYFIKFCKERNIKESTKEGYISSIRKYTSFHKCSLSMLIKEANEDEINGVALKNRQLKNRLLTYRNFLLDSNLSTTTVKTYFSKIKTIYTHFEIQIPHLPDVVYDKEYETNYFDLPTKEHIRLAVDKSDLAFKAIILFMASSGTAKAETLSLTVKDFLDATSKYYHSDNLDLILDELSPCKDIVPTFYLRRIKTDKYYYTFCSPEATGYIVKYLKQRNNLKLNDKLFPFSGSLLNIRFQEINDQMGWGNKGKYRFFRTHTLRKFHASNIQLASEYVDALQGRSKNNVHETYIKTNPQELKKIYIENMHNVMVLDKNNKNNVPIQEDIHITINVFLADEQINLY